MTNSTLIQADLLDWLRGNQWLVQNGHMPKAHAIVGDPPYYLGSISKRFGKAGSSPAKFGKDGSFSRLSTGFMNAQWDGFDDVWHYQAWVTEWAALLLDFVYPGAILAMYGSPRTYHRLVAGLEDAGWECFDTCLFLHGTGFPKATALDKLIDQHLGAEREVTGERTSAFGTQSVGGNGTRTDGKGGLGLWQGDNPKDVALRNIPATEESARFSGYKHLLKPAFEPIVLARAPRGSYSLAELALQFGVGSLNIDGCRVPTDEKLVHGGSLVTSPADQRAGAALGMFQAGTKNTFVQNANGRYPANIIIDEETGVLIDQQSGESVSNIGKPRSGVNGVGWGMTHTGAEYDDSGGASRFFYTVKPGRFEREAGLETFGEQTVGDGRNTPIDNPYQRGETKRRNTHPTVKSIRLNEWLCRLLLMPQVNNTPRRVLVPFAGSGSEMIGALLAGWDEIVGIEREAKYCAINEARRRWWAKFKTYEQAKATYDDNQKIEKQQASMARKQLSLFGD